MKRRTRTKTWPAPVKGLIRNSALLGADPSGAEVLSNFIPTAQGARLRGGALEFATVPSGVKQLITYRSGSIEELFAATETNIYNVASGGAGVSVVGSLTSGNWSFTQFATTGGQFLSMVNGDDDARLYDGAAWSVPAITGVATNLLSAVWQHKRRLWYVEKGTLTAWYLPVDSIAGHANAFPLDGIFRLGGALLFGGTWSVDSGDGLDDVMIFVTTEGEIAVYQGTDPSSAADWQLSGVYKMGRPLGKNGFFRAGGDMAILTEDGIVPVSEALQKDRAALQVSAITFPIEDLWQDAVASRNVDFNFSVTVWPTKTLAIVGIPPLGGKKTALVANTRTGAWAPVFGWDVQCLAIFQDDLYFGNAAGQVVQADVGGNDLGVAYAGEYVPRFQEMGSAGQKFALHARSLWRSDRDANVSLSCFADYVVGPLAQAEVTGGANPTKWGGGAKWGDGTKWGAGDIVNAGSGWQGVTASGFSLSPGLSVVSFDEAATYFEIVALSLVYEEGNAF
jgi:hypothetical protein